MSLYKFFFFFFNDTATTEIYTLSLHDALPIYTKRGVTQRRHAKPSREGVSERRFPLDDRSEEHTSELQSRSDLVCRLLLEKKKKHVSICETGSSYMLLPCTWNTVRVTQPASRL